MLDKMRQVFGDLSGTPNLMRTEPTTYTEANATYALASITGLTSGDYTLAAGDVSGRKITLDAQTGLTVSAEGTTLVAAIVDTSNSKLLIYSPCTQLLVYVGNTVNTTAMELEVEDVA